MLEENPPPLKYLKIYAHRDIAKFERILAEIFAEEIQRECEMFQPGDKIILKPGVVGLAAKPGATAVVGPDGNKFRGNYLHVIWDKANPHWHKQMDGGYTENMFALLSRPGGIAQNIGTSEPMPEAPKKKIDYLSITKDIVGGR